MNSSGSRASFASSTPCMNTMDKVRHILIRTSMGQIQKELSQLEHWLIHLPEDSLPSVTPSVATSIAPSVATSVTPLVTPSLATSADIQRLASSVEHVTRQMELQQATLDHIIGRLAILESVKEVHIQSDSEEPWMGDEPIPFVPENGEDDDGEVLYVVHKSSLPASPRSESVQEVVEEVVEVVVEPVQEVVKEEPVQEVVEVVVEPIQEVVEVVVEPIQEVVKVKEEPVQEVQVKGEPVQEVVEVKEEEEEEEEEDGVELEEITYQGVLYYRDPEQFVYSVTEEGEVSEEPIGYWKIKTKSIAFYNKK